MAQYLSLYEEPPVPIRLLILDDDALVGDTIGMMAASIGAESRYTQSAESFFATVQEWRPTHLVLDLVMPGVDGISVIQRLGEMRCSAQIVIISGVDNRVLDAAQRSARQHKLSLAGALSKPFSRSGLATLLNMSSSHSTVAEKNAAIQSTEFTPLELRRALTGGEIGPVFQPKVRCTDGSLIGFEALARWHRNGRAVCGPDVFVPVAEQSGHGYRLTEVMVTKSLEWLAENFGSSDHTIAINVPAKCFRGPEIVEMLRSECARLSMAPSRLVLEVTESGAIDHQADALDVLTQLRLLGTRLSIDDFGVGYSSLVQLARMPFSELKIDRSFVTDICYSSESQTIVSAIVGMTAGLGMSTVAEGVEDLDTYLRLRELGCTAAQGFFIGRPMIAAKAVAWSDIQ